MYFSKKVKLFLAIVAVIFGSQVMASDCCPECDWHKLLKSNEKFIRNPKYARQRAGLVSGQNPHYVILSCSDSRVPPEIIFEQGLGDLFVARVAGNTANKIVIDSMEFAVANYDVTTLIVLGHTRCGAVEGALARLRRNNGKVDHVIGDHLLAVLIPIEKAIVDAGINIYAADALEQAIKANVAYVVKQLLKRSPVISAAVRDGQIIIVGAEYSLKSGRVEELFIVDRCGYTYNSGWVFEEH
jgi:carbonic anhydrase